MVHTYQVQILNTSKFHLKMKSLSFGDLYDYFIQDVDLDIHFTQVLTQPQIDELDAVMSSWIDYETVDQLEAYLDDEVFPFIKRLINVFASENIAMGITQSGKTAQVLGLFSKKYNVPETNLLLPVSLKESFDTGSLYVAIDVLQKVRDTPSDFSGLSPFITDARLLEMKNKIETFLGVPLSE